MRRYLVSLVPTAVTVAIVAAACSSGGTSATRATPLPAIQPNGTAFVTIPAPPTTLTAAVTTDPSLAGGGQVGPAANTYTILSGDYGIKVAKLYGPGCLYKFIAAFNNLKPDGKDFPGPGAVLNIPPECIDSAANLPAQGTETTVAAGDTATTASKAASKTTTTTTAKKTATTIAGGTAYVIKANDTLSGIAKNFNVTMKQVMAANGWTGDVNKVLLIPGKTIKIPTP